MEAGSITILTTAGFGGASFSLQRNLASRPSVLLLLACLACLATSASAQQTPAGKFGFAIHEPGNTNPPVWTWLPESGHAIKVLNCANYPHDSHWDIVHPNEPRPAILEFAFAEAENAVVFAVTAEYANGPQPQTISLGSYIANETKSMLVVSTVDVGLPPIVIDIVVTPTGHAATLSGRVTDATGRPLGKVTLQLSPAHPAQEGASPRPYTSTTAGDGSYTFAQLEPGSYTVEASQPGYYPSKFQLSLTAGRQMMDANIILIPQPK
jgi:hypothetical protein